MGRVLQSVTQQLLVGGICYIKQKLHVSGYRGHHQVIQSITQQLLVGGIYYITQKLHVSAYRGRHQVLSY